MAIPPDQLTHEVNILHLMVELDEALARKTPQWAAGTDGSREATAGKPDEEVTGDHPAVVTGQR